MSGFTRGRSLVYLSAFAVWLAAFVAIAVAGGRVVVTTPGEALLLAVMFVACGVMGGVAWVVNRDSDLPYWARTSSSPGSPLPVLLSFGVRWVGFLVGAGIPAALRAL